MRASMQSPQSVALLPLPFFLLSVREYYGSPSCAVKLQCAAICSHQKGRGRGPVRSVRILRRDRGSVDRGAVQSAAGGMRAHAGVASRRLPATLRTDSARRPAAPGGRCQNRRRAGGTAARRNGNAGQLSGERERRNGRGASALAAIAPIRRTFSQTVPVAGGQTDLFA